MDKRAAKREACWRAASVVQSALDGGWPAEFYTDRDLPAVIDAIRKLIAELERRSVIRS